MKKILLAILIAGTMSAQESNYGFTDGPQDVFKEGWGYTDLYGPTVYETDVWDNTTSDTPWLRGVTEYRNSKIHIIESPFVSTLVHKGKTVQLTSEVQILAFHIYVDFPIPVLVKTDGLDIHFRSLHDKFDQTDYLKVKEQIPELSQTGVPAHWYWPNRSGFQIRYNKELDQHILDVYIRVVNRRRPYGNFQGMKDWKDEKYLIKDGGYYMMIKTGKIKHILKIPPKPENIKKYKEYNQKI